MSIKSFTVSLYISEKLILIKGFVIFDSLLFNKLKISLILKKIRPSFAFGSPFIVNVFPEFVWPKAIIDILIPFNNDVMFFFIKFSKRSPVVWEGVIM